MEKLKYVWPALIVSMYPLLLAGGEDGGSGDADVPTSALVELCGGADNVDGQECERCPNYTPRGGEDSEPDPFRPVVQKLEVDGRPAFLASWGRGSCVPGVGGYSGIVLVVKGENSWKRVDHERGISVDECDEIDAPAPDTTLLCRISLVRQGNQWTRVGTLTAQRNGLNFETLVELTDTTAALCREGTDSIEHREIHDVAYDADSETIEVEASALTIALPDDHEPGICADFYDEDDLRESRAYDLAFPYEDGRFQTPDEIDSDGKLEGIPAHEP